AVKVGGFAAQSGPVAPIGVSVRKGFEAYIKYVNDAGGVHGRKIDVVKVVDDAFDAGKGLAASKELVESDKVFALAPVLGTPGVQASVDYWVEKDVPVVYPMTGIEQTAHPAKKNVFAVQPNNFDEARVLTQYAVKDLGKKKVAVLWQNSDMGKQGLKGVKDILPSLGGEMVYDASHEAKATDFATPVLNAKQNGAEAVILYTTLAESTGILKEMAKQGLTAVPLTSYVNADPVNLPKLAGEAAVGLIAGGWVPVADPNNPDIKKFNEIYAKYNNNEQPNAYSTAGFIAAELLVKGLQDAGKDLTREKFVAALEALKGFNGIMAKDISYGPGDRRGSTAFYLNKVQKNDKGEIVMVQINKDAYKLSK
ncbi:MAG TPA: ABC transporter substrate-binding protein, partial [Symbiobacteriaceae bacterium]|nr:ABC transporter substrate-binding protein [Symbiobacteriaceae bacterium]